MTEIQSFAKRIKGLQYAMLTTMNDEGRLCSRPMTLQQAEFTGDLWFFVGRSSKPCTEIQRHPQVNLAFSDPKNFSFVSASGRAEIVVDKAKAQELWNPAYKAWFPEGLEDPELALMKVRVQSADHWESPGSTISHAIGFAKAILSHQKASSEDVGKHEHLEF